MLVGNRFESRHTEGSGALAANRRIQRLCPRGVQIAAIVVMLGFASPAAAAEVAEQPSWEPDDSWTYARTYYGTAQSYGSDRFAYTLAVTTRAPEYYFLEYSSIDANGAKVQSRQRWSAATNFENRAGDPARFQEYQWYRWPLTEGKSWEFSWYQPAFGESMTWTAKVVGWETITVPAGTFRALRIDLENACYYRGVDGGVCGQWDKVWYSPVAKRHVRLERRTRKGAYAGTDMLDELTDYHVR